MITTIAWTGGLTPDPYRTLTRREKYIVSELFREQMLMYIGRWGSADWGDARLFWKRARYDAHATARGLKWN